MARVHVLKSPPCVYSIEVEKMNEISRDNSRPRTGSKEHTTTNCNDTLKLDFEKCSGLAGLANCYC